jgi:hypothetical protein
MSKNIFCKPNENATGNRALAGQLPVVRSAMASGWCPAIHSLSSAVIFKVWARRRMSGRLFGNRETLRLRSQPKRRPASPSM